MSADRLTSLRALATTLEESIGAVDAHQRAPLAAQYRLTLAEIDALAKEEGDTAASGAAKGTPLDELRKRRAEREATA